MLSLSRCKASFPSRKSIRLAGNSKFLKTRLLMEHAKKLNAFIEAVIGQGGSDLHLGAHNHPIMRVSGALTPLLSEPKLTPEDTEGLLTELLTAENKKRFLATQEIDFSYAYGDKARFRGNGYFTRGTVAIALRLIPRQIKTLEELRLPHILEEFAGRQQGFFLVVGPVGQGRRTTPASMIGFINRTRTEHIVTIEDPIEYLFEDKKSVIEQREVRVDTSDFHSALQSMFRQAADVALIGEMR